MGVVYFNGSYSQSLKVGDKGCFQGMIMATLLYIIYVFDQPTIVHIICGHPNNYMENEQCDKNISVNYIDDNITEVTANDWKDIENEAENYLNDQKAYHIDNKLALNED